MKRATNVYYMCQYPSSVSSLIRHCNKEEDDSKLTKTYMDAYFIWIYLLSGNAPLPVDIKASSLACKAAAASQTTPHRTTPNVTK